MSAINQIQVFFGCSLSDAAVILNYNYYAKHLIAIKNLRYCDEKRNEVNNLENYN